MNNSHEQSISIEQQDMLENLCKKLDEFENAWILGHDKYDHVLFKVYSVHQDEVWRTRFMKLSQTIKLITRGKDQ